MPREKAVDGVEWCPPVWLVETHRDLWRPDIPLDTLRKQFPRVRLLGMLEVSNKPPRDGVEEVKEALRATAAELPLMGQPWPGDWQTAEDAIAQRVEGKQCRMTVEELWELMRQSGVKSDSQVVLAKALNDPATIRTETDDGAPKRPASLTVEDAASESISRSAPAGSRGINQLPFQDVTWKSSRGMSSLRSFVC